MIALLFSAKVYAQPAAALDTTFTPGTGAYANGNDFINATAYDNTTGKIYIGGAFTGYNGTVINRIARLNADGSLDSTFVPGGAWGSGQGPNGVVRAIAIDNVSGKIYVGGLFITFSGQTRRHIVRLNTDGTLDGAFNPDANGSGINDDIFAIAIDPNDNNKIYIGGNFTGYNGISRNRIARLNATGALDTGFNPGTGIGTTANQYVYSVVVQPDGKIIIGGNFTQYNGTNRNKIARINTDGSLDTSFNPGTGMATNPTSPSYPIAIDPNDVNKIYIGANFTSYNGTTIYDIARIDSAGAIDSTFNVGGGANGNGINAIVVQPADGKIIIGGHILSYTNSGGVAVTRNDIARLNTDGTLDNTFDPLAGVGGVVNSISLQPDTKIIIGGEFGTYTGVNRRNIARILGSCSTPVHGGIITTSSGCSGQNLILTVVAAPGSINSLTTYTWYVSGNPNPVSYSASTNCVDITGVTYTCVISNGNGCDVSVTYMGLVGTQELTEYTSVSVYPNPFADEITIAPKEGKKMRVVLYSTSGQLIFDKQIDQTTRIDTKQLASGSYVIFVWQDEQKIYRSTIIKG